MSHDELVQRGVKWLRRQGCGVVIHDGCRAHTRYGELPDVIGWRSGVSLLIEAKVSRSDFLSDKRKPFRHDPTKGMGDWRFYLCPPNVVQVSDLPRGWGLLWVYDRTVRKVQGPRGNTAWGRPPLKGNKQCETMLMYAALRRMDLRGHLPEIYDGFREV